MEQRRSPSAPSVCLMIEGQEGVGWPQWVDLASAAERHGFDGLFRSDHYLSEIPDSGRGALDAWGTICALAAVTSRIRLGTAVSPVGFRHPSVLAKLVTTADHVSGGRVELGIGAGWYEREHHAYGFPFPSARKRTELLGEQLELITGTWGEAPFSFEGEDHSVHGLDARPKPVQRPRPPIMLGGEGGPRSMALAARWADEYNTPNPTDAEIAERLAALRDACSSLGRDPGSIRFSVLMQTLVASDPETLERRAANAMAASAEDLDTATHLEQLAVSGIAGTPEQVVARLRSLSGLGVDRVLLECLDHSDLEMIELIGEEVLTRLADPPG